MRILHRALGLLFSQRTLRLELSVLLALLLSLSSELVHARREQRALAEEVIRLHVVAASNSPEDQRLKLSVRDRILSEYSGMLMEAGSVSRARELVEGELESIGSAAADELSRQGCRESVRVTLGAERFPQRVYGDTVLPAGEYTALKVVIGRGGGQNWWCVMFPPLCCFSDGEGAELPPGEEWELATEDTPRIRIRLRLLELLEKLRRP